MTTLIYRHPAGRTQSVGVHETVKRRILEQAGWTLVGLDGAEAEAPPDAAPPTPQVLPLTPLPDDFPAADVLRANGLLTVEDVAAEPDLTGIPGIGKATAAKVRARLAELGVGN